MLSLLLFMLLLLFVLLFIIQASTRVREEAEAFESVVSRVNEDVQQDYLDTRQVDEWQSYIACTGRFVHQ